MGCIPWRGALYNTAANKVQGISCCSSCHLHKRKHSGRTGVRVVGGFQYLVCCKLTKICLKSII